MNASKRHVGIVWSRVWDTGGAKHSPVMRIRDVLERPTEIRQTERRRTHNCRKMVVVEEDDPSRADEPTEKDQVKEDPVEAVVAVHKRQMKAPRFAEESRERDL